MKIEWLIELKQSTENKFLLKMLETIKILNRRLSLKLHFPSFWRQISLEIKQDFSQHEFWGNFSIIDLRELPKSLDALQIDGEL